MTDIEQTLTDYVTLFRGRADAYGSWEGGCIRQPLTHNVFRNHLHNGPFIGVYPTLNYNGEAHCAWGCTDIDYDDFDEARRLQNTFAAVGVVAWTERTRKGWHIWVFLEGLTPARDVRRMFLAAHQVARSKPTEVNPKQTVLSGQGLGNYVRLPYHSWFTDPQPERIITDSTKCTMLLEEFTVAAVAQRASAAKVAELADYYIEPPTIQRETLPPTGDMAEAARSLTGLGRVIFRDGPIEGRDRSTTLTHLAFECVKAGLPEGDALMILEDADLRWGKFLIRGAAGENELAKLIQRAYGSTPAM